MSGFSHRKKISWRESKLCCFFFKLSKGWRLEQPWLFFSLQHRFSFTGTVSGMFISSWCNGACKHAIAGFQASAFNSFAVSVPALMPGWVLIAIHFSRYLCACVCVCVTHIGQSTRLKSRMGILYLFFCFNFVVAIYPYPPTHPAPTPRNQ